jgi:D-lactate dehydrogenase
MNRSATGSPSQNAAGMKLVFLELEDWEEEYLRRLDIGGCQIACFRHHLDEIDGGAIVDAVVLSPFIYSQINNTTLARLPRLRLIATRSTGFDHIDLAACRQRGILVANVPDYGQNTVAEHTFALILSISRRIHKTYERTVRGDFSLAGLRGFDLRGRALGVVGTGSIGSHVIRIAKGFQMRVLAYDVRPRRELAEALQFEYVDLDTLFAESDIVTLHCPYNENTHHLINRESIRKFKRAAVLINTARGGLVETEALVRALDDGILSAAGLDVLEE